MQTKEEIAAYKKQYYEDNKEKALAYKKKYYEKNKEVVKAYQKQYRQDNKGAIVAYKKKHQQDNKEELATKAKSLRDARSLEVFEYKGGACEHCSVRELDYLAMYDYHHIDPTTKLYTVSSIMNGPMDRIMAEVDKCLLLCANCHRKEHVRLNKEAQDEII